jgi:hypothetical protein
VGILCKTRKACAPEWKTRLRLGLALREKRKIELLAGMPETAQQICASQGSFADAQDDTLKKKSHASGCIIGYTFRDSGLGRGLRLDEVAEAAEEAQ